VTGLVAALELTADARRAGSVHTIHCDNASAVTGINCLLRDQTCRWRRRWDGLWAHILTANYAWEGITLLKVKAHRLLSADDTPCEAALIVGNMLADKIANKLVDYYTPSGLPTVRDSHTAATSPLLATVTRLAAIRANLPQVPRPSRHAAFARHRAKLAVGQPHRLAWSSQGAKCTECYRHFRTAKGWNGPCNGSPSASVGVIEAAKGHRHNLAIFAMAGASAGLLVACLRCACFSQSHVCGLSLTCPGNTGTRGAYLRRLLAGRHPTDGRSYVQHVLRPWPRTNRHQRATLDIPAAFVAAGHAASSALPEAVDGLAPLPLPAAFVASGSAASSAHPGATGGCEQPSGPGPPPPSEARAPPDEEWDVGQLMEWFGEAGL
jgi:hypothetical protein